MIPINVAILIFEGVYLLDFAGPLEVFFDCLGENDSHLFNVYTVSPDKELKAHCGTRIIPDFDISSFPEPVIFVVPGGESNLLKNRPELCKWLIHTAENAQTVMSVCTGAFILADAGLLDGLDVTTWHDAIDKLQQKVPSAIVQKNIRFTDNGKIITTSGISAGIDGALHLVSKYFGKSVAAETAKYMDYDYWK
jgi:transcriptional regulator GlxA family with amidase domain